MKIVMTTAEVLANKSAQILSEKIDGTGFKIVQRSQKNKYWVKANGSSGSIWLSAADLASACAKLKGVAIKGFNMQNNNVELSSDLIFDVSKGVISPKSTVQVSEPVVEEEEL